MSQKIQVRRGKKLQLPVLDVGELGLAFDTGELFIGTPAGNVQIQPNNYVPGTPANWHSPGPMQIAQAMDRLAAAVAGLLGTPIP